MPRGKRTEICAADEIQAIHLIKDDDFAAFVSQMREAHEKVPMRLTGFV